MALGAHALLVTEGTRAPRKVCHEGGAFADGKEVAIRSCGSAKAEATLVESHHLDTGFSP